MSKALLIPVKPFSEAKKRLSMLLSPEEREELAFLLLQNTLEVVLPSSWQVMVLSADKKALKLAKTYGALPLEEGFPHSESFSVDQACEKLFFEGFSGVLRLPTDLPLLSSQEINQALKLVRPELGSLLVPSRDQQGTNLLYRSKEGWFSSAFGEKSWQKHCASAEELYEKLGQPWLVWESRLLAKDLDTPEDMLAFLHSFLSCPLSLKNFVEEKNIASRLKAFFPS